MTKTMTAKQRAALRKAQLASARKRKGKRKSSSSAPKNKSKNRISKKRRAAAIATGVGFVLANEVVGRKTGYQLRGPMAMGVGAGLAYSVARGGRKRKSRK